MTTACIHSSLVDLDLEHPVIALTVC